MRSETAIRQQTNRQTGSLMMSDDIFQADLLSSNHVPGTASYLELARNLLTAHHRSGEKAVRQQIPSRDGFVRAAEESAANALPAVTLHARPCQDVLAGGRNVMCAGVVDGDAMSLEARRGFSSQVTTWWHEARIV